MHICSPHVALRCASGGGVWPAARGPRITGEWTERSSGGAQSLMRVWEETAPAVGGAETEAFGTFARGTGELSGSTCSASGSLSGRWSVQGGEDDATGEGSFRLTLSTDGRKLCGEADSATGWRGEWSAERVADYPSVSGPFWAKLHPARLLCHGYNAYSQCCLIEFIRPPPGVTKPLPILDVVGVSAGAHHSCLQCEDGRLFCVGLNDFGQCGVPPSASLIAPTTGPAGDGSAVSYSR